MKKEDKPNSKTGLSVEALARDLPRLVINRQMATIVVPSLADPSQDRKRMTERLSPELQAMLAARVRTPFTAAGRAESRNRQSRESDVVLAGDQR